jgi:gamma-tubulin complex component 2
MFAQYTTSLARHIAAADPDLSAPADPSNLGSLNSAASKMTNGKMSSYDPSKIAKMFDLLKKYEDNFSKHLKVLLDTLNYLAATETAMFLSLCARLSTANVGSGAESDVLLSVEGFT